MLIRPVAFWAERAVTLLPRTRIAAIDPDARSATAADGRMFGWDRLIWATGGAPRRLTCDGHDLAGVHCGPHPAPMSTRFGPNSGRAHASS